MPLCPRPILISRDTTEKRLHCHCPHGYYNLLWETDWKQKIAKQGGGGYITKGNGLLRGISSLRNSLLKCWEIVVHKGTEDSEYISIPERKAILLWKVQSLNANSFKNKNEKNQKHLWANLAFANKPTSHQGKSLPQFLSVLCFYALLKIYIFPLPLHL